ncbi:MAG: hypothetical protein R3C43_19235 [Chloroflexota bacterium]
MAYNPPLRAAAYEFYVSLRSQSNVKLFQTNPTLAAGDVKVSKNGGTLANLATLPTVVSSGKLVKVALSATEMTADNVTVIFSDAAGDQWCDLTVNIQTVNASVPAQVVGIDAGVITSIQSGLATAAALTTVAGYVDTEVAAIKAKTDNLPAAPAAVGSVMALADGAITEAKISSGGLNAIADAILKRDMTAVTGEAARSMLNALRFLRNRWFVAGGVLTVTKENDTTVAWTAVVSDDAAAEPITGVDPT